MNAMLAVCHSILRFTLVGPLILGLPVWADESLTIEVFTTSDRPVVSRSNDSRRETANVTTYLVDGLEQFEAGLSDGLPAEPDAAKAAAMDRLQQLDDARLASAKNAAIGLAKALQYGVDRTPVIVFNGHAVIYGVTDLAEATERYRAWQRAQTP